mgnify:CR=1 FL=1
MLENMLENLDNYLPVLVLLAIWELVWKGMGLWKSAQRKQKVWFVAILIVNSMGILPIVYLLLNPKGKK